ncbi:MAG: HipA domain-containing protein [Magnetococcales bacterium]|nr:HipA domain-containing protein [Magnetococcales bacterium]
MDETRYESGTVHMKRMIPDFDVKKGQKHNIKTVLAILGGIGPELVHDMGKILIFDALIGNTDRHQENWGILWRGSPVRAELAPAFDNGTSLGHEITDSRLVQFLASPTQITCYIDRGYHHMRWDQNGTQCGHFDMISWLLEQYHVLRHDLAVCLDFDQQSLYSWLRTLPSFMIPDTPTPERIEWIINLLGCRMQRLHQILINQ